MALRNLLATAAAEQGHPASRVHHAVHSKPDVFERLEHPVPILYLATFPDWELAARFSKLRVLQKPFHAHELLEAVGQVTGLS